MRRLKATWNCNIYFGKIIWTVQKPASVRWRTYFLRFSRENGSTQLLRWNAFSLFHTYSVRWFTWNCHVYLGMESDSFSKTSISTAMDILGKFRGAKSSVISYIFILNTNLFWKCDAFYKGYETTRLRNVTSSAAGLSHSFDVHVMPILDFTFFSNLSTLKAFQWRFFGTKP